MFGRKGHAERGVILSAVWYYISAFSYHPVASPCELGGQLWPRSLKRRGITVAGFWIISKKSRLSNALPASHQTGN